MNILIVGNSGIIGSYLEIKLANYIENEKSNDDNILLLNSSIVDLRDVSLVNNYVQKLDSVEIIIFLVGLAHSKGKIKNLPEYIKVNYETLVNLISALENSNKVPENIIFASTISVYGENYNEVIFDENIKPNPSSPYAITKLMAEKYLLDNFKSISWILRFTPVYSSGFLLNIDRRTKIGGYFYRVGNGSNKLSLCNIENIWNAIEGITNYKVPTGIYNISDSKEYSYNELLAWQNAPFTWWIPKILVKMLYVLGKMFRNNFLQENTIKLLTDNIFPNTKINSFVELPYTLDNVSLNRKGDL